MRDSGTLGNYAKKVMAMLHPFMLYSKLHDKRMADFRDYFHYKIQISSSKMEIRNKKKDN